jgi:hypothetical protein
MTHAAIKQYVFAATSENHALDTLSLLTRSMYPMAISRSN